MAGPRVGPIPDEFPGRRVVLDPLAKPGILVATARHHGDEAAAGAVDVLQVVVATQLGVADVEKVGAASDSAQRVPSLDVGDRVVGVAVGDAKLHRHPAVGGDGEDEEQLLQIRPMVFRIAVDDGRCAATAQLAAGGPSVLAAESNRGGVVMQLLEAHAKTLADGDHHLGQ